MFLSFPAGAATKENLRLKSEMGYRSWSMARGASRLELPQSTIESKNAILLLLFVQHLNSQQILPSTPRGRRSGCPRLSGDRPPGRARAARSVQRQALRAVLHHQAGRRRRAGLRRDQAAEVRGELNALK